MGDSVMYARFELDPETVKRRLNLAKINYLTVEPNKAQAGSMVIVVELDQPQLPEVFAQLHLLEFFSQLPA